MSEFCFSISKKTHFSSLLFTDFIIFCSFILSHPLYFSYFLFFSPYLLKLLSFLSPLFITTFLLLLTLSTVFPCILDDKISLETSEYKVGFFLDAYRKVVDKLRSRFDDDGIEFRIFEELEACVVVFNTIGFNVGEREGEEDPFEVVEANFDGKGLQALDIGLGEIEAVTFNKVEENPVEVAQRKCGGDSLECFLQDTDPSEEEKQVEIEAVTKKVEENPVEVTKRKCGGDTLECFLQDTDPAEGKKQVGQKGTVSDKVGENQEESLVVDGGSKPPVNKVNENPFNLSLEYSEEYYSKVSATNVNPELLGSSLGSFGSMRKEKEWKRTLACKLYEERRNVDEEEEEGMDLLWETYEADSGKVKLENKEKKVKSKDKKKQTKKKPEVEYYDDEEEDDMDEQFCCLQALKFSTGKMNLGMGRPNLAKFSKALKGIGWFHQISRHGKKGYN
ncbi:uncharacterized protein LOC122090887 [Macadamia integrifolia]|uniref:uncharacterized protein LOC122090887 n=1 Tax=Macadamia integrifolia TaxID=60698 RepID=UPI001C4EFA52|nr:uncharacterized protein LOC122090887 [Macadamia integrifolia]